MQAQGRLDKEALARLEGDDFSDEFGDDDENDSDCSEGGDLGDGHVRDLTTDKENSHKSQSVEDLDLKHDLSIDNDISR